MNLPFIRTITVEQAVQEHAQLVRMLAYRLVSRLPASVDVNDLIQAGMVGLIEAANRYDKEGGANFETFATLRINGAMIDELRRSDWCPRSIRKQAKVIEKAIAELERQNHHAPSEQEIARFMGVSIHELHQQLAQTQGNQMLYTEDLARRAGEDGDGLIDIIADDNAVDPLQALLSEDFRQALIASIQVLPERERQVLYLLYDEGLTQKEVSRVLELSEGRISQIRSLAISRIRATLDIRQTERPVLT